MSAQIHPSDLRAVLDDLPEQIAWAESWGSPIVVPDPCTEPGRRLLHTLGAYIAEFRIDRVKPDSGFASWLDEWKRMKADGWDVTTLIDNSDGTVIAMASRIVRA